ncbi:hypothetical protein [Phytoactinopolyspora halotolerans]|uniref:Uncharacterized protein n=1 Tax=Phytoactinopolyspora halotolerans TaxID=1981512 RepID=A0A6L9SK12_9ACTN|nr:hypothetical protein [Phytoactinopolyspora halotolerans]NEE04420.1 hypothetical protein [Phytoactinopolyspora halotolerans]
MLETLGAFVATVAGKAVLGTAAVAVGVGGAHAAGVVDVPGLPQAASATAEAQVAAAHDKDGASARAEAEAEASADHGVDGDEISDRATDGDPVEGGKAFGVDVAEKATGGVPDVNLPDVDLPDVDLPDVDLPDNCVFPDDEEGDDSTPDLEAKQDSAAEGRADDIVQDLAEGTPAEDLPEECRKDDEAPRPDMPEKPDLPEVPDVQTPDVEVPETPGSPETPESPETPGDTLPEDLPADGSEVADEHRPEDLPGGLAEVRP